MTTKPCNRKLRNLREEETNKHFEILNLCFKPWDSRELWRKKYLQHGFDLTKNVIIVEENGEWIGGGTAWFRHLLIGENKVKAYIAGDLHTHPDHRGKGVYSSAMRGLNEFAREKGAALGFGFISTEGVPFVALPKYGFVDIWYPTTKLKVLRPENFLSRMVEIGANRLHKFEGMVINIITFPTKKKNNRIAKSFLVRNGKLREVEEHRKADLVIKSDLRTLFNIYNTIDRRKLLLTMVGALLRRRLSLRLSFSFLRRLFWR